MGSNTRPAIETLLVPTGAVPAAADNSAHESSCDHGGHFGAEYRCDFGLEVTPRLLQSRQHLLLRLADKEQCQIGGLVAEAVDKRPSFQRIA